MEPTAREVALIARQYRDATEGYLATLRALMASLKSPNYDTLRDKALDDQRAALMAKGELDRVLKELGLG